MRNTNFWKDVPWRSILIGALCTGWLIIVSVAAHWLAIKTNVLWPGIGFYIVGLGVGPLGLYFAAVRTRISQEQSQTEQQRLISEDFSRSVQLLGDESAAVRQGGIYALGFLAQESEKRYETAIKIVASYIRETGNKDEGRKVVISRNGVDVEAALSVIRNRNRKWEDPFSIRKKDDTPDDKKPYLFDLSSADLLDGDMSNTALARVNMSDMKAEGCIFANTKFFYTNMVGAKFDGCDFFGAVLASAYFQRADSDGGNQGRTQFINCDFSKALLSADFEGAELRGAKLYGADLTKSKNLNQKDIDSAEGDMGTLLPDDLDHPVSWDIPPKYPE